ncbi:hypothetical protein [Marinobacter oulmenensis]|uniref:DUF4148 domain-containing protein n=1 Tax=Marinobacter oulmenensis TaxID=643747 RepID=A0A840UKW1_9GAMM|nr:hypothetical protein [Marinobacter oulmenensis]MBB5322895.1 hypothetical protein [Marinobacter oulmenensis]
MKKIFAFVTAVTLSTSALAGNVSNDMDNAGTDLKDKIALEKIVNDDRLQYLHKEMTNYGFSESGMDARLQMMSKEGEAYHNALDRLEASKKEDISGT